MTYNIRYRNSGTLVDVNSGVATGKIRHDYLDIRQMASLGDPPTQCSGLLVLADVCSIDHNVLDSCEEIRGPGGSVGCKVLALD